MNKLDTFIKSPTEKNWSLLDEWIKLLFSSFAVYCLNNNKGDLKFSKLIIGYFSNQKKTKTETITSSKKGAITPSQKRGLQSLFLALQLVQLDQLVKVIRGNYPLIKVYLTNKKSASMQINFSGEKELKGMFRIQTANDALGISAEWSFYPPDAKEYLLSIFRSNNSLKIAKITLQLGEKTDKRLFYSDELGTVWDAGDECFECEELLKKYGIDCGVNCDYEDAMKKYRALALKHHPDKGGDKKTFQTLQRCKEVVINEKCHEKIRHLPKKEEEKEKEESVPVFKAKPINPKNNYFYFQ